jgi:GMP synthase (glutamine-hydrolysing)
MILVVRNEHDPEKTYHEEELATLFPDRIEWRYPHEGRPDVDAIGPDGVVITGSTAGVYEAEDRPWIADQQAWIRELIEREVPTLGVCFGHQNVNAALGGRVEHRGMRNAIVEAELADDPLFSGLSPHVAAVHGDWVVERGEGMEVIASIDGYEAFGTRHREAPVWTVQFHPECTERFRRVVAEAEGWDSLDGIGQVNSTKLAENFRRIVRELAGQRA